MTAPERVRCDVCPRYCRLREGQRGFYYVRMNRGGRVVLDTYGRSSGFGLDPVEKKPLNHFLPGSTALSFGTAGCNLGCRFCQNHEISTSRAWDTAAVQASPDQIAEAALHSGARSVTMTYNDPVIFAEYAMDTAAACRKRAIHPIAVTAGYITEAWRERFFASFDAVNMDLKGFTQEFYRKITGGDLEVVKGNLAWLAGQEHRPWLELTTLLIPGLNDSESEIAAMAQWIVDTLGPDVPHHFSAFHPDHRMLDRAPTPPETLRRAREIAMEQGERYVYTGNVHDLAGDATYCPRCGTVVIQRDWYRILAAHSSCPGCGYQIPGVWD